MNGQGRLFYWRVATWVSLAALLCRTVSQEYSQTNDLELLEQTKNVRQSSKLVQDAIANGIGGRSLTRGAVERFTILPHYDFSIKLLTSEQQKLVKSVLINGVVGWLADALRARPMATSITLERSCSGHHHVVDGVKHCHNGCASVTKCGPVAVPDQHLGPCLSCSSLGRACRQTQEGHGINGGHFLLYVSALPEPHCWKASLDSSLLIAEAGHCAREGEFDRPVAGYINYCPNSLSTDPASLTLQQHATLRQLLHALAFSERLFPFYHNEDGYPHSNWRRVDPSLEWQYIHLGNKLISSNVVRLVTRNNWTTVSHTVSMVVTPNVLREVRQHFDCMTLEGAELENQGSEVVAGRLWERRAFGEELMAGDLSGHHVLSRVSMALLHDTGWYLPDYSYAGQLSWGRGRGCVFVRESCGNWKKKSLLTPYCDEQDYQEKRTGCVNGRTSVGPCLFKHYAFPLPREYQYLLSERSGGSQVLADYCPLYGTREYGDTRVGHSCLDVNHAVSSQSNFALEEYGSESRCFQLAAPMTRPGDDLYMGGLCYKFYCKKNWIEVKVRNQSLRCGRAGRKARFEYLIRNITHQSFIVCPAYSELCAAYDCINKCSDQGSCVNGECRCFHGYYGEDCSQSYSQHLLSCDDVQCLNGGKCSDKEGWFNCSCQSGFTGALCEQEVIPDPCVGIGCHGNGFCTRTNGGKDPKCNCYRGYNGRQCDSLSDLCALSGQPCVHGQCVTNTTVCVCTSDYWGERCDRRVDYCHPTNPCPSTHLCTHHNATQNYSCTCPLGYMGPNCSQVDHCADSPCLNGGTCVNQPSGYSCECARGYKGKHCKNRENPCKVSPCGKGGKCRPSPRGPWGTVYCECSHGYSGGLCQNMT